MKENKELGGWSQAEEGGSMEERQIIMCDILNRVYFFFSNYITFFNHVLFSRLSFPCLGIHFMDDYILFTQQR